MKKKLLLFLFLWITFSLFVNSSCHAADDYTEADMKNVTVRFCGETWDSMHNTIIYVEPWEEKNLCLEVTNFWTKKVSFEYWFSESGIGNGRYCKADMSTWNSFSILIPFTQARKISIEPTSTKKIEEKIIIPPGMSWLQLWCLWYKLSKPENLGVWWLFNLVIRKVGYIDIVVWWESTVKSSIKLLNITWGIFSTNKKVKATVDDENNLNLSFLIENEWNVWQNITITWKIYNSLWFQKDFVIDTKQVPPWSKGEFSSSVGILPTYKWFFTVKFNVKSDPIFMFPIANEKLKEPGYIHETWKIFIFSWLVVILFVVLLFILYRAFKRRKVKIIQQPISNNQINE